MYEAPENTRSQLVVGSGFENPMYSSVKGKKGLSSFEPKAQSEVSSIFFHGGFQPVMFVSE